MCVISAASGLRVEGWIRSNPKREGTGAGQQPALVFSNVVHDLQSDEPRGLVLSPPRQGEVRFAVIDRHIAVVGFLAMAAIAVFGMALNLIIVP